MGLLRRKIHIVVEIEHLHIKRRLVRENSRDVVVYFKPALGRLNCYRAALIRDYPVHFRRRIAVVECCTDEVYFLYRAASLLNGRVLTEHPRDELKLRDVLLAVLRLGVVRADGEVEPRHAESLFVYRVVVHRISVRDMSRADHSIVLVRSAAVAELERKSARHHGYLLAVRELIVERPAHIKIIGFISCCRTHNKPPESFFCNYSIPVRRSCKHNEKYLKI